MEYIYIINETKYSEAGFSSSETKKPHFAVFTNLEIAVKSIFELKQKKSMWDSFDLYQVPISTDITTERQASIKLIDTSDIKKDESIKDVMEKVLIKIEKNNEKQNLEIN